MRVTRDKTLLPFKYLDFIPNSNSIKQKTYFYSVQRFY